MSLRCGDLLEPDAMRLMLRAIVDGSDLVYSDYAVMATQGDCRVSMPRCTSEALAAGRIVPVSYMVRRDWWQRLGGWRAVGRPDLDFIQRAFEAGARIVHLAEPLYRQRLGASAIGRAACREE